MARRDDLSTNFLGVVLLAASSALFLVCLILGIVVVLKLQTAKKRWKQAINMEMNRVSPSSKGDDGKLSGQITSPGYGSESKSMQSWRRVSASLVMGPPGADSSSAISQMASPTGRQVSPRSRHHDSSSVRTMSGRYARDESEFQYMDFGGDGQPARLRTAQEMEQARRQGHETGRRNGGKSKRKGSRSKSGAMSSKGIQAAFEPVRAQADDDMYRTRLMGDVIPYLPDGQQGPYDLGMAEPGGVVVVDSPSSTYPRFLEVKMSQQTENIIKAIRCELQKFTPLTPAASLDDEGDELTLRIPSQLSTMDHRHTAGGSSSAYDTLPIGAHQQQDTSRQYVQSNNNNGNHLPIAISISSPPSLHRVGGSQSGQQYPQYQESSPAHHHHHESPPSSSSHQPHPPPPTSMSHHQSLHHHEHNILETVTSTGEYYSLRDGSFLYQESQEV